MYSILCWTCEGKKWATKFGNLAVWPQTIPPDDSCSPMSTSSYTVYQLWPRPMKGTDVLLQEFLHDVTPILEPPTSDSSMCAQHQLKCLLVAQWSIHTEAVVTYLNNTELFRVRM